MYSKKNLVNNENGFGHVLILVFLAVFIALCAVVYLRVSKQSAGTFTFGPKFPDISTYHNIDSSTINDNDASATHDLTQAVNNFTTGNPGLAYVDQDMFDGCGLFTTKQNGDFAAAYGKICSRYLIAYFSSTLDSSVVTANAAKWFNTTFFRQSDVENGYLHLCGEYLISELDPFYILNVYTLDPKTMEKDTIFCNKLSKINTTTPTFSSIGMLGGAIGADSKYQEVRSRSNINKQNMIEKLKNNGAKTVVSVTLNKKYYQRTLN
jgi:hypothetical protein